MIASSSAALAIKCPCLSSASYTLNMKRPMKLDLSCLSLYSLAMCVCSRSPKQCSAFIFKPLRQAYVYACTYMYINACTYIYVYMYIFSEPLRLLCRFCVHVISCVPCFFLFIFSALLVFIFSLCTLEFYGDCVLHKHYIPRDIRTNGLFGPFPVYVYTCTYSQLVVSSINKRKKGKICH